MSINGFRAESSADLGGLEGASLVVACVSVGNVGQLAVDVILGTLEAAGELTLLTQLHHPAVIPLAGPDPVKVRSQESLLTNCALCSRKGEGSPAGSSSTTPPLTRW